MGFREDEKYIYNNKIIIKNLIRKSRMEPFAVCEWLK